MIMIMAAGDFQVKLFFFTLTGAGCTRDFFLIM